VGPTSYQDKKIELLYCREEPDRFSLVQCGENASSSRNGSKVNLHQRKNDLGGRKEYNSDVFCWGCW